MKRKEVEEYLKTKGKELRLQDFEFYVQVSHQDGTILHFSHAYVEKVFKDKTQTRAKFNDWRSTGEDGWLCVWTEHNGYHFYYLDDLQSFSAYRKEQIPSRFME